MIENFKSQKIALLVLDVQNYFFDKNSPAYLENSPAILPAINQLLEHAASHGWPIIATSHRSPSKPGNLMSQKWKRLPDGEACKLFPALELGRNVKILFKEHYSAFFETDLAEFLRRRNVRKVVACGVMTHLCVDTTVRHAFMLGFWPIVVSDACCSKSDSYHSAALNALSQGFAEILPSRAVGMLVDDN